jgi:hypothetical protein
LRLVVCVLREQLNVENLAPLRDLFDLAFRNQLQERASSLVRERLLVRAGEDEHVKEGGGAHHEHQRDDAVA